MTYMWPLIALNLAANGSHIYMFMFIINYYLLAHILKSCTGSSVWMPMILSQVSVSWRGKILATNPKKYCVWQLSQWVFIIGITVFVVRTLLFFPLLLWLALRWWTKDYCNVHVSSTEDFITFEIHCYWILMLNTLLRPYFNFKSVFAWWFGFLFQITF